MRGLSSFPGRPLAYPRYCCFDLGPQRLRRTATMRSMPAHPEPRELLPSTPAATALGALIAGLTSEDAVPSLVEALSPQFAQAVGVDRFAAITHERRKKLAPLTVLGADVTDARAVARLRA